MAEDNRSSNPKITYSEASDRFYYDWNGVIRPATEREIAGAMERLAAFEHEHDALLRGRIPTHRCKICGALWILWPAGTAGMAEASWSLFSLRCGQCCDCVPMLEQIEPLPRLGGSAPETSAEFEGCHFVGGPPLPFTDWNSWAASAPRRGVTIRASEKANDDPGCRACGRKGGLHHDMCPIQPL